MTNIELSCVGNNRPTRLVETANNWFAGKALSRTKDFCEYPAGPLTIQNFTSFRLHLGYNPDVNPFLDTVLTSDPRHCEDIETYNCRLVLNPRMNTVDDLLGQLDNVLGEKFIPQPHPYSGYESSGNIPWSTIKDDLAALLAGTNFEEPSIEPAHFELMTQEIARRSALAEKAVNWFDAAKVNPRPGRDPIYGYEKTVYSYFRLRPDYKRPYFVSTIRRDPNSDHDKYFLDISLKDMSDPAALAGTITGIFSPERAGNILDKIWNEDIAQQFVDSLGH